MGADTPGFGSDQQIERRGSELAVFGSNNRAGKSGS